MNRPERLAVRATANTYNAWTIAVEEGDRTPETHKAYCVAMHAYGRAVEAMWKSEGRKG